MLEDIEGFSVDVSAAGAGSSVIFVHGLGCDQRDWQHQIDALAGRFRCVSFDLPGHGNSANATEGGLDPLARVLGGVIVRHGGAGCVLVGHSLGCRLILEASSRLSPALLQSIRGIAFLEQSLVGGGDAAAVATAVEKLALRVDSVGIHEFLRPAFAAMFMPGTDPKLKERVLERLSRLEPRFARELLLSATAWEARAPEQLERLTIPVLLIQSTYLDANFKWNHLVPLKSTPWIDLVRHKVKDCSVEILSGCGHFSPIEAAEAVNQRLLRFLESLPSAARAISR
jgi:pimeloyl-ACP methyl ester carboxylesterase